ncbi:hypothetical protein BJ912DRAFT_1140068 [Pholiota molesta]|nr:hypothetical protein BJ912DRAFT_1140068 [Pholiota molesta]
MLAPYYHPSSSIANIPGDAATYNPGTSVSLLGHAFTGYKFRMSPTIKSDDRRLSQTNGDATETLIAFHFGHSLAGVGRDEHQTSHRSLPFLHLLHHNPLHFTMHPSQYSSNPIGTRTYDCRVRDGSGGEMSGGSNATRATSRQQVPRRCHHLPHRIPRHNTHIRMHAGTQSPNGGRGTISQWRMRHHRPPTSATDPRQMVPHDIAQRQMPQQTSPDEIEDDGTICPL